MQVSYPTSISVVEGSHPEVFAANGSHGIWGASGKFEYSRVVIASSFIFFCDISRLAFELGLVTVNAQIPTTEADFDVFFGSMFELQPWPCRFPSLADFTSRGIGWRLWYNLVFVDASNSLNGTDLQWLNFQGRWGNDEGLSCGNIFLYGSYCGVTKAPFGPALSGSEFTSLSGNCEVAAPVATTTTSPTEEDLKVSMIC